MGRIDYLEGVELVGEALMELGDQAAMLLDKRLQDVLLLTIRDVKDYRDRGLGGRRYPWGPGG